MQHPIFKYLVISVGGALEWYDYMIYGYLAQVTTGQFFPNNDISAQIILVFLLFMANYVLRPVGGIIFGHIGDKRGRKTAVFYTMLINGIATLAIAATPTYQQIGVLASILLFIFRIIQGIAYGGNCIGAMIYAYELAPNNQHTFWISTVFLGFNRGLLLAIITSSLMLHFLTVDQINTWGWRVVFSAGLVMLALAFYLYRYLPETPYYCSIQLKHKVRSSSIKTILQSYKMTILQGTLIASLLVTMLAFFILYLPTFLHYYGFSEEYILNITIFSIFTLTATLPIFGWMADRITPHIMLCCACVITVISAHSATIMIIQMNNIYTYFGITVIILCFSMCSSASMTILISQFPTNIRYTGASITYNLSSLLVVSIAPVAISYLHHKAYSTYSIVTTLITASAIITFIATMINMFKLPRNKITI